MTSIGKQTKHYVAVLHNFTEKVSKFVINLNFYLIRINGINITAS